MFSLRTTLESQLNLSNLRFLWAISVSYIFTKHTFQSPQNPLNKWTLENNWNGTHENNMDVKRDRFLFPPLIKITHFDQISVCVISENFALAYTFTFWTAQRGFTTGYNSPWGYSATLKSYCYGDHKSAKISMMFLKFLFEPLLLLLSLLETPWSEETQTHWSKLKTKCLL